MVRIGVWCNKWPKIRQKMLLHNNQLESFALKCSERIRKCAIYGWKALEVFFLMVFIAWDLEFSTRRYDRIKKSCSVTNSEKQPVFIYSNTKSWLLCAINENQFRKGKKRKKNLKGEP